MFLSDYDIHRSVRMGDIKIDPWNPEMVQPASIDLTLADGFKVWDLSMKVIDPREKPRMVLRTAMGAHKRFVLHPGRFCLATTLEKVTISDRIVGRLEGKSSLGRLGLTSHVTAGFFDPGFSGYATLELFNASGLPIFLYPGMKICQMSFAYLVSPAVRPYGHDALNSKYQNQERVPTESEFWRNPVSPSDG